MRYNDKVVAREAAQLEAAGHCVGDPHNDHQVDIIIAPPDRRSHDVDGVLSALKPTLDGIAKGLGIDDERFNPIHIYRATPVQGGRVTITVHDDLPF